MSAHILFVDDEIPIRELLGLYFKKKGMDVTASGTGEEALRLAEKNSFDLVILDVNLGKENGMDLLDTFKRNHPDLPVIMFTSLGEDPVLLKDAELKGASAFMCKTDPLDNLLKAVQRVIKS